MEYIKKKSLFDVLYRSRFQLSLLHRIRMSRHCLRALVWLHGKDIAHRDVKSLNILVTDDYSCKLTDFGCAKLHMINLNTPNVGSRLWMAPEVKMDNYDPLKSDIWSIGIVMYEILNGQLPQYDQDDDIAFLPFAEDYIGKSMIVSCVNKKIKNRPNANELLVSLDNWIEDIIKCFIKCPKEMKENDDDIIELYEFLVKMNPYKVDITLTGLYGLPEPQYELSDIYNSNFYQVHQYNMD